VPQPALFELPSCDLAIVVADRPGIATVELVSSRGPGERFQIGVAADPPSQRIADLSAGHRAGEPGLDLGINFRS
jgi:hypothetical protein